MSIRHSTLLPWLQNGQEKTVSSLSIRFLGGGLAADFLFPMVQLLFFLAGARRRQRDRRRPGHLEKGGGDDGRPAVARQTNRGRRRIEGYLLRRRIRRPWFASFALRGVFRARGRVDEGTGCGGEIRRSVPIHLAGERRNREGRGERGCR